MHEECADLNLMIIEKLCERDLHLGTHNPLGTQVLHYDVMTPQQWIWIRINDLGHRITVPVLTLLLRKRCLCFWVKSSIFYLTNELQLCMSRFQLYESFLIAVSLLLKRYLGRPHLKKKMHDGFLNSILQEKKTVSTNFVCVWTYIHVYSRKYMSYK